MTSILPSARRNRQENIRNAIRAQPYTLPDNHDVLNELVTHLEALT